MQPTYLPWAGYFNLIHQADTFVFLDDVQFEHQSWQTRNRILLQGNEHLLVVPIRRCPLATPISDVRLLDNDRWQSKHWKSMVAAYGRAPHGKEMLDLLEPIYAGPVPERLAEMTESIITVIARALGLDASFQRSSDLGCGGKRSSHLVAICEAIGADHYLSPQGARDYLAEDGFETMGSVKLEIQAYRPKPYRQCGTEDFVSHLSVVDVIANLGMDECGRYVRESQ